MEAPGAVRHEALARGSGVRLLDGVRILLVEDDDDSRFGPREARVSSRAAGFHYHLTKPYDVEKPTEIVSGLVRLTRA